MFSRHRVNLIKNEEKEIILIFIYNIIFLLHFVISEHNYPGYYINECLNV